MSFGGKNLQGQYYPLEQSGQQSFRQQNQTADINSFGYNNNSQQYMSSRSQDEIDVYLKEALKKEISLRFMLGIYKLHALQVKYDSAVNETSCAFEKIKNNKLELEVIDMQQQMLIQSQNNQNKTISSSLNASKLHRPQQNDEWEKQLEYREASLIDKMKTLKFQDTRVRDSQVQTLIKGEEVKRALDQQDQNKGDIQESYDQRLEELIRRENNTKFLEEQLNNKISQYEEMIQDLKNQEQELDYRIKEIKFEPLNLLGSSEQLRQRLANMKKEIYDNFISYTQNLPYLENKFSAENNQFYELFQNWEENPEFLKVKSELLKNLEVNLLEERFKMEIVENYLKKEYETVKNSKEELSSLQDKHLMLEQYEQNLKQENEIIQQKKKNLENQMKVFQKEIGIYQQYSVLTQNTKQVGNVNEINQHILQLISNEPHKMFYNQYLHQFYLIPNSKHEYSQLLKEINEYNQLSDKLQMTFRANIQYFTFYIKKNRESQNYNDDIGTIKGLEEENNFLRDELSDLKRRINEYEQSDQNQNNQFNNQYEEQNTEIQQLIKQSKEYELFFIIYIFCLQQNFIFQKEINHQILVDVVKKQYQEREGLNLTFKNSLFILMEIEKLDQLEFDVNAQQYLDYNWENKAHQLQKSNRFPFQKLSKKRKEYEMAAFDYERKKFHQNHLAVLLNSILLRQRRAEKLNFVIAFHRFARNCFRLSCNIPRENQVNSARAGSLIMDPMLNIENIGKGAFVDQLKWEKPKKRDKSPLNANSKIKAANMKNLTPKQIEEKLVKEMQQVLQRKIRKQQAICIIYSLTMKKEIKQMHAISKAFGIWRHANIETDKQLITRELNYVNYQIQERVFSDNLFKTKIKLQKTEIDSKLSLLNELLSSIHQSVHNN